MGSTAAVVTSYDVSRVITIQGNRRIRIVDTQQIVLLLLVQPQAHAMVCYTTAHLPFLSGLGADVATGVCIDVVGRGA